MIKQLLFLTFSLFICLNNVTSQSAYEVPVNIPAYVVGNNLMQLITPTNNGWDSINSPTKKYFYVEPGDYHYGYKVINLTKNGAKNSKRYISLYNGNNTHPGKLNTTNLANVSFLIEADYWVIDRMSLYTHYNAPIRLENASHNVINRFLGLNSRDIGFRHGCDSNTVQNCRMEITNRNLHVDIPAFGMINVSNGAYIINAQITNNHFVNNETKNYVDGFQTVLHDGGNSNFNVTGTNYEGTIVDNNLFYVTDLMYTDCNGVYNINGNCGFVENGVDLKAGSTNPNNPVIISNNKMWGIKNQTQPTVD